MNLNGAEAEGEEAEGEEAGRRGSRRLRAVLLPARAEIRAGPPREDEGQTPGNGLVMTLLPDAAVAIGRRRRTLAEVKAIIQGWVGVIHPRAARFTKLVNVLVNIAINVAKDQDPVVGRGKECICWHGDIREDEFGVKQGLLTVERPDGEQHTVFI